MRAYEYMAELLPDWHLSVPEKIKNILTEESKIRIMLLLEDEETAWRNFAVAGFMRVCDAKDAIYDELLR